MQISKPACCSRSVPTRILSMLLCAKAGLSTRIIQVMMAIQNQSLCLWSWVHAHPDSMVAPVGQRPSNFLV